ncbi:NAD-dependent epimerase/dehydratase family protein, partial [Nocardia wallacei]|uniref:NAD-dependent epimerase/dehydratase family protein n=1 Tax=Nocardia wallacei TaxID=480035 RepID=UPI00313D1AC3
MRVLITGVTEPSGRAVARMLLAAGHEVVGVDGRRHRYVDPRVEMIVGNPADRHTCARALSGCDGAIHLSTAPATAVATAARETGVRLVVPVTAGHEVPAAVTAADALVVRTALVAGRDLRRGSWRLLETLLGSRGPQDFQLLHNDDLERFLVLAAGTQRTGVVELAAPGTVSGDDARRILRAAGVRYTPWVPRHTRAHPPVLEPVAAYAEWGFRCGWTAREVVDDIARGLPGRRRHGDRFRDRVGAIPLPAHVIPARATTSDGHALEVAAPDGLEGEFDDRVDSRIPVHTATNTSEALPGPMTPLTIDLQAGAIRLGNEAMGRMIALEGIALEHWVSRVTSVLGHSFYINASIGVL